MQTVDTGQLRYWRHLPHARLLVRGPGEEFDMLGMWDCRHQDGRVEFLGTYALEKYTRPLAMQTSVQLESAATPGRAYGLVLVLRHNGVFHEPNHPQTGPRTLLAEHLDRKEVDAWQAQ